MNRQLNASLTTANIQSEARGSLLREVRHTIALGVLALLTLLLPCSLLAAPIIVKISDLANGPPEVEVDGAPHGYDVYTGPGVNNPSIEDGALITLFGVDTYGSINEPDECGWRFLDPKLPQPTCPSAVDIVWIQHDYNGPFGNGDLQIGFNSSFPSHYYTNPDACPAGCDVSLGPLTYKWQTVYADATVVVLFKAQKPPGK